MPPEIPVQRLHEFFLYNSETGIIVWKNSKGRGRIGSVAGYTGVRGYNRICLDGKSIRTHRLAWTLYYNEWPATEIDHIDKDKLNNRITNLRLATRSQNNQNKTYRGTRRRGAKWTAQIRVNGHIVHLGVFDSEQNAHSAYVAAKKLHHLFWNES